MTVYDNHDTKDWSRKWSRTHWSTSRVHATTDEVITERQWLAIY